MIRGFIVRGAPAVLVAMTILLSACSADSTSTDAASTGDSDSTETTPSEPSESEQEPVEPTYSPRAGEMMELPQSKGWAVMRQGRYAVRLTPSLLYEVDVPDRAKAFQGRFLNTPSASSPGLAGVFFVSAAPAEGTQLPEHPCRDHTTRVVGPTVSDLAGELRRQPLLDVTKPVPVTLDGNQGLYLEVKVPDKVDAAATCENATVALFSTAQDSWGWKEGFIGRWWILDVDGDRMVVNAQCDTDCTKDDFDLLTKMAESISWTRDK